MEIVTVLGLIERLRSLSKDYRRDMIVYMLGYEALCANERD